MTKRNLQKVPTSIWLGITLFILEYHFVIRIQGFLEIGNLRKRQKLRTAKIQVDKSNPGTDLL